MRYVTNFRCFATLAAVAAALSFASAAHALDWYDNWSDGNFADGSPETWTPLALAPGDYDASSGDFILTGTNVQPDPDGEILIATVNNKSFGTTSVRTRTFVDDRSADPDNNQVGDVGVVTRYDSATASGYLAVLDDNEFLTVFRADAGFLSFPFLEVSDTGYTAASDVMIQLDITGTGDLTFLEVTLWEPGDPMPASPQYSAFDTSGFGGLEMGPAGIIFVENTSDGGTPNESSGVFRYAQAADRKILFEADFDVDGDVDGDDFLLWQVGFGAGITVGANKIDGDFDNDGDVDGDDFLGWQVAFPSPGSGAGSGAVPEPAGAALAAVMALVLGCGWRRRCP